MNEQSMSTRQLCFLLAFFFPLSKLILLPAALSGIAENHLLLSALIFLVLQGVSVFAALFLTKKKQAPVSVLIGEKFGHAPCLIYQFLTGLYFLFSAIYPIAEFKGYVLNTMYDTRPSVLLFMPFFLFCGYAAAKGTRSTGRSADLTLFFFPLSFIVLLVMAVEGADFTALLPFGSSAPSTVLHGVALCVGSCGEGAWLLSFTGEVKVEKRFLIKTMGAYAVGSVAVLVFLTLFYATFNTLSLREIYALAKIARYNDALKIVGRVDYVFLYAIAVVQLFVSVVPVQCCVKAFSECFHAKPPVVAAIVTALLAVVTFLTADKFLWLNNVFTGTLFPVTAIFAYLLPLLSPLLALGKKEKKYASA